MIAHNPKSWFNSPFHYYHSDTLRRLFPWIIGACVYSTLVAWLELEYWKLGETSRIRHIAMMHTLLGFVISFALVFRTNTAYERWWEGRKLWGALMNSSRNLAMKLSAVLPENDPAHGYFRIMIPAYATALKNHLRSEDTRIELFDQMPDDVRHKLDVEKHIPNQVAAIMMRKANDLVVENKISGQQLQFLSPELQSFTEICGGCERIKNTPIPYSYIVFLKRFITVYIATLPFGYVFNLGYFVVPMVGFIFYVLASLELIAEEIEEPFGADENDLPLGQMTRSIQAHIHEII